MRILIFLVLNCMASMNFASMNHNMSTKEVQPKAEKQVSKNEAHQIWTCSMHPQIKADGPGKCPICIMDLIPLEKEHNLPANTIELSTEEQRISGVMTYPVKDTHDQKNLILYGRVKLIPSLVYRVTAWSAGRIDRLYIASQGERVKVGDPLYEIYSPTLISSQQELIQAAKLLKSAKKGSGHYQSLQNNLKASRQKLIYLGLSHQDVHRLEELTEPLSLITVYAKRGGVIRHVAVNEGEYVKPGSPILLVADMSELWIETSVYEDDLKAIQGPMRSMILLDSHPEREIYASLLRIDPFVDPKTRSSRAIFLIKNPNGDYSEDGFARVQIEAHSKKGLMIPHSSALFTGQKAVVFVKKENRFESRLVRILEKTESFYRVIGDLKVGDEIVSEGTFKLDSEFQIQAKESMMSMKDLISPYGTRLDYRDAKERGRDFMVGVKPNRDLKEQLSQIMEFYLELQVALSEDSVDEARDSLDEIFQILSSMEEDQGNVGQVVKLFQNDLKKSIQKSLKSPFFKDLRQAFKRISIWMLNFIETGWIAKDESLQKMFCPMAFGKEGAIWIQEFEEMQNPYFGTKMQSCGERKSWSMQ